jgi:ribosomal protein L24
MATIVGSVRAVVGRVLKVLEKTNAIKIEGQHILVTDPEKLMEMGK